MNPPTTGHQLLVNKLVAYAKQHSATPRVYLSHSTGKKDPLQYDTKISFARQAFGAIVKKSNARNVIQILQSLEQEGYTDVTMIVGSDRVPEFKKLLNAYNGKEYKFDKITIVSAGERDPDADDVSGMSASKMRALAVDNKDAEFMRGAPSTLKAQTRKQMLVAVRKALLGEDVMDFSHDDRFIEFVIENSEEDAIELPSDGEIIKMIDSMDIADLDLDDADAVMLDLLVGKEEGDAEEPKKEDVKEAVLSGQARQKLAQRMKGMSKRLARLRQIKAKQMPAAQRLRLRARKAALMALRKRATGKKNLDYNSLSRSQRIAVDTALVQRFGNRLKKAVDVLSKRILPKIRSMAQKNVAKARDMKKESINELFSNKGHLLGKGKEKDKEGSAKDVAQDKVQAARRGMSVSDWEKTKADAAHDSPLNVDTQKLNTLDTDPTLNDRSAPNPKQSHLNVNRKLMHYARSVDEGRKSSADKDARDAGDTNIIYQMRKIINSRGEHETTFADGSKHKISVNDARKMLDKFEHTRLPADKHNFTVAAGQSLKGFREVMLHGAPKESKRKVSLGGKQFKEFYSGAFGRNRTVAPYPQDSDEPPGTRRIAEASSAGGVDSDANDNPNKPRKTNPKLDLLLRLGLADNEELQKYRRALRTSKKQALASPEMRKKLADLLDKLIDLTTGDAAIYSRARTKIVTTKEAYSLLRKSEMSGIDANIIAEVYVRGLNEHDGDSNLAFDRVNSFVAGGMASLIDGDLAEAVKSPTGGLKDACWSGYTAVGMKMKNGKKVPNCVPKEEATNEAFKIKSKEAETSYNTHDDMMKNADRAKLKTVLGGLLKDMTPVQQKVIRGRFWDNKTLAQIAKEMGVSPERIRQHEAKALRSLKAPINAKKLTPFREESMDEATKQQKAAGAALATKRGEYAGGKKGGAVNRMALMKTKDLVKLARGKKTNEEVEQIDELSPATLSSYKSKAAGSETSLTNKSSTLSVPAKDRNAAAVKANQRRIGMKLATKKIGEEVEQVDEISSAMLYRAKQAAQKKAGWLMPGDKGKGDKAWNRVKKFRDAGVAKEKQERSKKVNEAFAEQTLSTHPATSLQHRAKRVKSFHAWEPPAVKEANRVADVKMVKVKLPDGRVVFRKERTTTAVQNEAAHTHPTGRTPYSDLTNKQLRADLTKKEKAASETYTGSEPTSSNKNDPANRFVGTDSIRKNYAAVTPGQTQELNVAAFAADKPSYDSGRNDPDSYGQRVLANTNQGKEDLGKKHLKDIKKALSGIRESNDLNESFAAGFELAPFARDYGITVQSAFEHHPEVQEALDAQEDAMNEAIYQGRDVPLNKPMKGDVKKSKVYVRDPSTGNIKKVNYGDKKLSIKKDQPARKKSYCARSGGQGNLTKKTSANYWSRRAWDC
jgi:RNA polymerase sigma factor (sigma-70 family)